MKKIYFCDEHAGKKKLIGGSCSKCHAVATAAFISTPSWRFGRMINPAKQRAHKRNVPFSLTVADIKAVWPVDDCCPVFHTPFGYNRKGGFATSPSLDCIRPEKGYIVGNIAVISLRANRIKQNETDPAAIKAVAEWLTSVL